MCVLKFEMVLRICLACICLCACSFGGNTNAVEQVPVLIWTHKLHHNFPLKLAAGHAMDRQTFSSEYVDQICTGLNHVVLFIEEKLCLTEFARYGNVHDETKGDNAFMYLQAMMESEGAQYEERVGSPVGSILDKGKSFGKVIHLRENLLDVPLLNSPTLLIVHLPPNPTQENKIHASFKEKDELIKGIMELMKVRGEPFTSIYTAIESGQDMGDYSSKSGRKLLYTPGQVDVGNYTLINVSDCFVLFFNQITFSANGSTWQLPRKANEPGEVGSYCDNYTSVLNLNYAIPNEGLVSLNMSIFFELDLTNAMWRTMNWTLSYNLSESGDGIVVNESMPVYLAVQEIQAPAFFSYSCTNATLYSRSYTNWREVQIYMKNFQIQAFHFYYAGEFGRYNDCIGFFSKEVWTMLVSLFVLIAILLPGIHMLSSIKTMDRHEDPKGKNIQVHVSD